jgi:hypothetical protein
MALSMDEQRVLDEMERKLANDDPLLASRLRSFGHPGLAALLRSPRIRLAAASAVLVAIAVVSVLVYALGPLRASTIRHMPGRSTASPAASKQVTPTGHSSVTDHSGSRAP